MGIVKTCRQFSIPVLTALLVSCSDANKALPLEGTDKVEVSTKVSETDLGSSAKSAWFGELHVHTEMSFDADIYNVRVSPDDAYMYGKGHAINHTSGQKVQASKPIDFMAVTDHAEYLGVLRNVADPEHPLSSLPFAQKLTNGDKAASDEAFGQLANSLINEEPIDSLRPPEIVKSNWQKIVDAAEKHNDPGVFTTLIGYEWTSLPGFENLHRNVIFRGGKGEVPELPFSALDSSKPEDLWQSMEENRARGIQSLAIPHNSNLSNGSMFPSDFDSRGSKIDKSYTETRNRNERLVEVTQIKGTSETHPKLSPNDEWANFEIVGELIGSGEQGKLPGSYARRAYLDGLILASEGVGNPYKFGLIGSSDTHNGAGTWDEDRYMGKTGISDDTLEKRRTAVTAGLRARTYSASGLAGVWAGENTRESIFDGLYRRETFATTGPRIKVRLFGGWDVPKDIFEQDEWMKMISGTGVTMGQTLPKGQPDIAPTFVLWALKDPDDAPLQRLQVVKGWMDNGESKEQVFDVACSDGAIPDDTTHRCPDNGAAVNLETCETSEGKGDVSLSTTWQDPKFDSQQGAFYYLRVLQNPTCRWSTFDANEAGLDYLEDVPKTLQERAWSSPIWYDPE